jgi:hypothetical protein
MTTRVTIIEMSLIFSTKIHASKVQKEVPRKIIGGMQKTMDIAIGEMTDTKTAKTTRVGNEK